MPSTPPTGDEIWAARGQGGFRARSSPLLVDGTLYVVTTEHASGHARQHEALRHHLLRRGIPRLRRQAALGHAARRARPGSPSTCPRPARASSSTRPPTACCAPSTPAPASLAGRRASRPRASRRSATGSSGSSTAPTGSPRSTPRTVTLSGGRRGSGPLGLVAGARGRSRAARLARRATPRLARPG